MKLHEVEWDSRKIAEFWNGIDYLIQNGYRRNDYFSFFNSDRIARVLNKYIGLNKKSVLDYGCGTGDLLEIIAQRFSPKEITGVDTSSESIKICNERLVGVKNYVNSQLLSDVELGTKKYDVVICTEVIEHLDDESLNELLSNVNELLDDNGVVFFTTPNNERLIDNVDVCPDCGCYFHRVQHVRSWNDHSISEYLEKNKFVVNKIIKMNFREYRGLLNEFKFFLRDLKAKKYGIEPGNLVVIARKGNVTNIRK